MITQMMDSPKGGFTISGASSDSLKPIIFQCSSCGECCSSFSIPIEAEKAEVLLKKPWVQARLAETGRLLKKMTGAFYTLPLTEKNECVFLSDERRCLIHQYEGIALKPLECQRFPFAGVYMPDGTLAYDTSANCKTIAIEHLATFLSVDPEQDVIPIQNPFPKEVSVGLFRKIPWKNYLSYLEQLQPLFQDKRLSVSEALWRARYAHFCSKRTSKRERLFPERWLNALLVLLFLRKPYGSYSFWQILTQETYSDPKIFGSEAIPLRTVNSDITLGNHQPDDDLLECYLKGYIFNLLRRKVYLAYGYTPDSLWVMSWVGYALVCWYTNVLAWLQGRNNIHTEDVILAIRLTERYYTGHQPRFLTFFKPFSPQFCLLKCLLRLCS
jgi:Fe-S-cluster containining protein